MTPAFLRMVTTDKLNRRGGLGTDLLRRSVEMARKLGFRACKTEATGDSCMVFVSN